ncbi:MAG: SCO family protein [Betaproteobacteria bacterium]
MSLPQTSAPSVSVPPSHWRRYRTLYLLIAVCLAPVIASYLTYYVFPPSGRTNYGDLVSPQRPLPALTLRQLDGAAFDLKQLRGKWLMGVVDGAACSDACRQRLWQMRQLRTATGKDSDRIERVFLVTDGEPLETMLLREHEGAHILRADSAQLRPFLALEPAQRIEDHMYLIDPIGNYMMRWPAEPNPSRIKRDLSRLLKASRIG